MPRFASKRNRPDAKPATKLLPLLSRHRGTPGGIPAVHYQRAQCIGMSKNKLKRYWLEQIAAKGIAGLPAVDDPKYRYSEIAELARTYGFDTDSKKLSAEVRASCRCGQMAIAGGMVCRFHGGSIKAVMNNAKDRILDMIDPALGRLNKIIVKGKHEPAVVAAIKDVLDRAGLKKPDELTIQGGYSEDLINRMAEVYTEEELAEFIRLSRKLESVKPEDGDDQLEGSGPRTINVKPETMAELIKTKRRTAKMGK